MTNTLPIPICKFGNSQTIPIPICTEVGSANLFLFLFAGKKTIHWALDQSNQCDLSEQTDQRDQSDQGDHGDQGDQSDKSNPRK